VKKDEKNLEISVKTDEKTEICRVGKDEKFRKKSWKK